MERSWMEAKGWLQGSIVSQDQMEILSSNRMIYMTSNYDRFGGFKEACEMALDILVTEVAPSLLIRAARYSAEELITQREKAKTAIDAALRADLARYHVIVEDVQLTEFDFSPEFNKAIESKQTEVQKYLKSKNTLQRIEVEANSRIAQARGEAEAIRIQASAIQNQGGAEYVELKKIEKWDGKLPTVVTGESSPILLNMDQK